MPEPSSKKGNCGNQQAINGSYEGIGNPKLIAKGSLLADRAVFLKRASTVEVEAKVHATPNLN
jgi:hypothetical protein